MDSVSTILRPTFTVVARKLHGTVTSVVIQEILASSIILARTIVAMIHH